MPWYAQILPPIVAAAVALWVLRSTIESNRALQRERLDADLALAERRFKYERDLIDLKRRREVCEKALSLVYQARDSIRGARSPGIRGGEGQTRPAAPNEEGEVAETRNTYFIPIERLNRDLEIFSGLQSLKYEFAALFGDGAVGPINALLEARWEVAAAAHMLIQFAPMEASIPMNESMLPTRQTAFASGNQPDKIETKMADAVTALEATCKPVLQST